MAKQPRKRQLIKAIHSYHDKVQRINAGLNFRIAAKAEKLRKTIESLFGEGAENGKVQDKR